MHRERAESQDVERPPEAAPRAPGPVILPRTPALDLTLARTIGNSAFCSAIARSAEGPLTPRVLARQGPPAAAPPATAPAQQSPEARIVNMRSLLAESMLGDGATQVAQASAILREFCTPRNRWVSHVIADATGGPKVKPLFTLTPAQAALRLPGPENGRVALLFDASFFQTLTEPTFHDRVRDVQAALTEIMEWRIAGFMIDAQDLQDPEVEGRLRDLRASDAGSRHLRQLAQRTTDTAVRDHVNQILGYSTALPRDATIGTSSTTLRIGTTDVTILPDTRGGTVNETTSTPDPLTFHIRARTRNGIVTSFTGVPTSFRLTFQTSYAAGTGNPESATSAYGRGTTPEDRAAGNTSLRFHEGRHGADFLEYLNNNPRPLFQGTVDMPAAQFQQQMETYGQAHRAWLEGLDRFSTRRTDCVGAVTIDQHHQGEVGYRLQCTP